MHQQDQPKYFLRGMQKNGKKKANDEIYSVINDRHRAVHYTLSKYPIGS